MHMMILSKGMSTKVVGKFQSFVEYTGQLIPVLKFNDKGAQW
jgi:hypothetical protein